MTANAHKWLYGLGAAAIGGGANAVTTGVAASAIRPDAFNFHAQLVPTLELMGVLFLVSGLLSAFAYLSKAPLPPEENQ